MENECSCTAIQSSTGLGKSTMMRKHAGEFISKLRASGDSRSVVVFVPTINLGQEQMHKFREEFPKLRAESFIGLSSDNPNKINVKMCERIKEANELIDKGIAITNLCGSNESNKWCSHHINSGCENPCGYSRQNSIHADIWFMPHQKLFTPKPLNIDPVTVVIDEAFWEASIGNEIKMHISSLTKVAISSVYEKSCEIIMPYLTQAKDGYLDIGHIRSSSNQALAACYKASDELKSYCSRRNEISPSMTPHAVKKALGGLPSVSVISFWRLLAEALKSGANKTPYLIKVAGNNNDCLFHINEKQSIHKDWDTEALLLDATLSEDITKLYFSDVITQVIECPMSETTVTQISDMPLSKRMMLPDPKRGEKKNVELKINIDKLVSILKIKAASITKGINVDGYFEPIKILLVTNKAVEETLKEHKDFPKCVATMHYGATSGIDIYKDVPSLVVAGRLMLPVMQSEKLGSLLKGEVISGNNAATMYPKRNQTIVAKSSRVEVASDYHVDPIVEQVRYAKTEGELIQAMGRARAIRRDETKPLHVLILTNVPVPIEVDLLTEWNEVVPTKLETLLSDKKIAPLSYSELARKYPELFNSEKVARTDVNNFFNRYTAIQVIVKSNLSAFSPIYNINREKGTQFQHYKELGLVRYTRNTKGAKPCFAVIFDLEANEIEEALSLAVGELKSYQYICAFSADGEDLP